jgi:sugar phosphate isomerase/epimerase
MTSIDAPRGLTRRELLATGLASAGVLTAGRVAPGANAAPGIIRDYGPFKIGLQSYSLRGYTTGGKSDVKKALAVSQELGVHFWESYTQHVPIDADARTVKALRQEIEAHGIHVGGYGVVHFTRDESAARKIFDFAGTLGVSYLSADPSSNSFDVLDRLVEEYGIAIGIHNHGPGHKFALIDTIAAAIKDHSPRIGCCIDTGHFLRSREDPVRAAEVFGKRVYGVHLKDVKNAETFTILGQGDLRTVDLLKVLAANKYDYVLAIEYEEKPEDPLEDIKACLAEARRAIAAIGQA